LNTGEGWRVPAHLLALGIRLVAAHRLSWFDGKAATISCVRSDREQVLPASGLVVVGQREPVDGLHNSLRYAPEGTHAALPFTLTRIGDCEAPAIGAGVPLLLAQSRDRSIQPQFGHWQDAEMISPSIEVTA
jgi:dimethylamine/trimethylamine dehydrogenase